MAGRFGFIQIPWVALSWLAAEITRAAICPAVARPCVAARLAGRGHASRAVVEVGRLSLFTRALGPAVFSDPFAVSASPSSAAPAAAAAAWA